MIARTPFWRAASPLRRPTTVWLRSLAAIVLATTVSGQVKAAPPPAESSAPQIGLYKDGRLVETWSSFESGPETKPGSSWVMALEGVAGSQQPQAAAAPPGISEETKSRNAAFAKTAQSALEIRDLLNSLVTTPAADTTADRDRLAMLLQAFLDSASASREALNKVGQHVAELGLDPEIAKRHSQTVEDFEKNIVRLQQLLLDAVAERPGSYQDALKFMEQSQFVRRPSLKKAGPTVQVHVQEAPRLTREEADALLGFETGASAATQTNTLTQLPVVLAPKGNPSEQLLRRAPLESESLAPVRKPTSGSGRVVKKSASTSAPAEKPMAPASGAITAAGPLPRGDLELLGSPPVPADLTPTIDVQITKEIIDKATELGNSPLAIYEFVRNNVTFQPYLGSRKGSVFTLRQRAGNDTDQASLLLALLRAAGIPCRYVRGTIEMTPQQAMDWLGVEDAATAGGILTTAGLDGVNIMNGGIVAAIRCTRVWVEAYVPYSNYRGVPSEDTGKIWIPLDPAFSGNTVHAGEDVLTAMGFSTDIFLADYITTFHAQSPLEKLQTDIQTWLNVNRPGKTVADIVRTVALSPLELGLLPASLPYQMLSVSSRFSELESTKRYQVRFHLYNGGTTFIDYTTSLPELIMKRLTIDYVGATPADQATIDAHGGVYQTPPNLVNVKPRLKLDGTPVVTSVNFSGMGYTHAWDMHFIQPAGDQNVQPVISNEITAGNGQSVAFDTFLDVPLGGLLGSSSGGSLLDSTMSDTASEYLSRVDRGEEKASGLMRIVTTVDVSEAIVENAVKVTYSFGIPVTFEWTGLIVDADRRIVGPFAMNGDSSKKVPYMKMTGYDASNMENRIFEDMYAQQAISTIKILELANDAGIGVCTITTSIGGQCAGFSQPASVVSAVNGALAKGHHIIIPRAPITVHLWSGTAYIDLDPTTGAAGYIISGGINGNISVAGGATVDVWPINLGCAAIPPITGTISPNGFADGAILCADNSQISYTVTLQYNCKDANGNITPKTFGPTSHTVPPTKRAIVKSFGPGKYTISIPDTQVQPVSFTLVYVEFTKDEEYVCWQQNGTFDAKALLTSDSTKDDSLLSWDPATINNGLLKFDAAGASYTIKVTAGGIAGCSDSFKLNVAKLKTETVATTPADRKRLKLGVGEEVKVTVEPSSVGTVTWTATGSGKVDSSGTFTAGESAGSATVFAKFANGSQCDVTFNVVGPSSVVLVKTGGTGQPNPLGVQMTADWYIGPEDVNFSKIAIAEQTCTANCTGYFTYQQGLVHTPGADLPVTTTLVAGRGWKCGGSDNISGGSKGSPYTNGTFTWPIPWHYKINGNSYFFTTVNHVKSISIGADGKATLTLTKLGASQSQKEP